MKEIIDEYITAIGVVSYDRLTPMQRTVLCDILYDVSQGRTPMLLGVPYATIYRFFGFLVKHNEDYEFITTEERWKYEEQFFMEDGE